MTTVYPYDTLFGDLNLSVAKVEVDAVWPGKDLRDPQFRLVSAYSLDRDDWETIKLDLTVAGPADELGKLDDDGVAPDVVAVAFSRATNGRQAVTLKRSPTDPSRWQGALELERKNFFGKVEIYAVLTAKVDELPARWMAETNPWLLYFDEPEIPPIEGTLRVKWANFKGPEREECIPEGAETESFYVALEESPPVVFLNLDFPGLPDLLSDEPSRPEPEKALREAEYRRIATAAWTEVVNVAVAAIRPGEDGEEPRWPDQDWQEQALRSILPGVYKDMSLSEALAKAYADFRGEGALTLQSRSQVAIEKQIGAGPSLRRSIARINAGGGS